MARFYDRFKQRFYDKLDTQTKRQLTEAVVFDMTAIDDWWLTTTEGYDPKEIFYAIPPFDPMWCEIKTSIAALVYYYDLDQTTYTGVESRPSIRVAERLVCEDWGIQQYPEGSQYGLFSEIYTSTSPEPLGTILVFLDKAGTLLEVQTESGHHQIGAYWEGFDKDPPEDLPPSLVASLCAGITHSALIGIKIGNARNMKYTKHDPPEKLSKKHKRKHGFELCSWRTLEIPGWSRERVSRGGSHASPRFHVVRGHFKARKTGLYWWNAHARGDATKGVVNKDYEVKPND